MDLNTDAWSRDEVNAGKGRKKFRDSEGGTWVSCNDLWNMIRTKGVGLTGADAMSMRSVVTMLLSNTVQR
jgi:hypothetical protein